MQLVPPLTSDPAVIAREQPAGKHLPYARHVDDVTIETRDGLLLQTVRLGGLLFETADTEEINYRAELRDAMLKAVGSSRFAVYHHVVRRKAEAALDAAMADAVRAGPARVASRSSTTAAASRARAPTASRRTGASSPPRCTTSTSSTSATRCRRTTRPTPSFV